MKNNDSVYIKVRVDIKSGQTESSIEEIIQEADYSFSHPSIVGHEIVDILNNTVENKTYSEAQYVDPFDMLSYGG